MQKIKVKIKKIHPDAKIPFSAYEEAAGFDFYSIEEIEIPPGQSLMVRTGICYEIEPGFCLQIWDRSGLGAKGIHRFAGLVDSDYRGEIKIVLFNSTKEPFKISKGDRIAQGSIIPVIKADFEEAKELNESKRGSGGFNSTGKN